jgi:hypothetical protein
MKLIMLAISTMLLLGLACGSEYPFGSKVTSIDNDFGHPLHPYGAPNPGAGPSLGFSLAYWETGVVQGFDSTDTVYLHQGPAAGPGANPVLANDVRLTSFGNLPPGSKVTPQDNDINSPLTPIPGVPTPSIAWANLYGGPNYDLYDPAYIHQGWPTPIAHVDTNDVRLTQSEGSDAGTRVLNSHPDASKVLAPAAVPITPSPMGVTNIFGVVVPLNRIEYVDVNGNNQYDYPDDVYLRTINLAAPPAWGMVRVNDVRLSGPVM